MGLGRRLRAPAQSAPRQGSFSVLRRPRGGLTCLRRRPASQGVQSSDCRHCPVGGSGAKRQRCVQPAYGARRSRPRLRSTAGRPTAETIVCRRRQLNRSRRNSTAFANDLRGSTARHLLNAQETVVAALKPIGLSRLHQVNAVAAGIADTENPQIPEKVPASTVAAAADLGVCGGQPGGVKCRMALARHS
jgi:hypothetical protein